MEQLSGATRRAAMLRRRESLERERARIKNRPNHSPGALAFLALSLTGRRVGQQGYGINSRPPAQFGMGLWAVVTRVFAWRKRPSP